jgi:hypothetical protein
LRDCASDRHDFTHRCAAIFSDAVPEYNDSAREVVQQSSRRTAMNLSEANRIPGSNPRSTDELRQLVSISLLVLFACFVIFA